MEDRAKDATPAVPDRPKDAPGQGVFRFAGNSNDVVAIVGATAAALSGLFCLTGGYGLYCLPVIAVVLGGVGLLNAKASLDPERTRRWGWVSISIGSILILAMMAIFLCFVVIYGAFIISAFSMPPSPNSFR